MSTITSPFLAGNSFISNPPWRTKSSTWAFALDARRSANPRDLAARAPYFHNGSAPDIAHVIGFYDRRFQIGLTREEQADLAAFLGAL